MLSGDTIQVAGGTLNLNSPNTNTTAMVEVYTVMCAIPGHKGFSVKIANDQPVSELSNLIRDAGFKTLGSFQPSELKLYKINACGNTDEERNEALQKEISKLNDTPLGVFDLMSDVFPEKPPAKTYHILVAPPQGEHSTNGRGHW